MQLVTPISVMLTQLANLQGDDAAYVDRFVEFAEEIGCSLFADHDADGGAHLRVGYPCDLQSRHRNRWMRFLVTDLNKSEGKRALLLRSLVDRGHSDKPNLPTVERTGSPEDEALVDELRDKGWEGPFSADFLAEYRMKREFMRLASKLEDMPDGVAKFKRTLVRCGILPPENGEDEQLHDAWQRWKTAALELNATDVDDLEEVDVPAYAMLDAADEAIILTPAVSPAGALAKLRRALHLSTTAGWVETAILERNDTALYSRAEELDNVSRLVIDAIAVFAPIADSQTDKPLLDAFSTVADGIRSLRSLPYKAPDAQAQAIYAWMDPATMALKDQRATTIEGVLAKLRHGFQGSIDEAWGDHAVLDPTCEEFKNGLAIGDLFPQIIWSAIEDLARIAGLSLKDQAA